uniref:Integrase, catalytic region, zinc finger, CCHC-type, peptidase aspartic, catalytic n=1 Tax=Tanacetum cinerariifolium TaxID=118510 RepID=A0A699GR21_TANCI|nr:integrase, catalytic region, zinc finger, CCHC-type, peptidase aspartic, catalytic [Tanacetum cinerariifolium]
MDSMISTGQKNTRAEYMILSGVDNYLPMLDKDLYDSWKSRMELYMQNREHGIMILESVVHGPLIWLTIKENGVIRTKKYVELSPTKKIQADCDMKAINIILQAKEEKGCYVVQGKSSIDRSSRNGKVLNEEELEFLADPDIVEAKAVLMANLSSYGLDVLSEDTNSFAQQDAMLLSVFEQLSNQVTNCNKVNEDNLIANETLSDEFERYKERLKLLEERQNVDLALGFQNPFYLKKAQQIRPILYDDNVIAKETNVISIVDSEETLMLEEESRSKMLLKQNDPMVLEKKVNTKPIDYAELNRLSKDFDSASYSACMHVKLIQEFLSYVRDTCLDIHKPSEKLVSVMLINKKKIVRFADTVASSSNMPKVTNRPLLSSTRVKPSTSASGSKPSGITKNDRISRTPSSTEKNKVEVQSRKVKFKLNKQNSYSKNVYNEHVKYHVKGAQALYYVCNECLFDTNHAMYLIDHVNSINMRDKSASKKNKKRKEWKPIGKVFNSVGYKGKPTERAFTLDGNACPLTRITDTNKVPVMVPIPLELVAPEHVVTRVYTRRPKVPKSVPNSKTKVAKTMTASIMELDSGCSKHITGDRSQLTNFIHKFLGTVKFGNDQVTKIIGDIMASSRICLLSKSTKTKSWLWHQRLSYLNFGALNHLVRNVLVRGLPRLKFKKDYFCYVCAMGKIKKQSHKPKSEDINQEKLYLLHMDLCGPMRVASVNRKKYILVIVDDYSRFI